MLDFKISLQISVENLLKIKIKLNTKKNFDQKNYIENGFLIFLKVQKKIIIIINERLNI